MNRRKPMTGNQESIPDFSSLTCTNLMIRLKMLLKKTPAGTPVEIIVRRDQKDTVEVPFSRTGYEVQVRRLEMGNYRITLTKKEPDGDPA
jgi:ERCC4-type nuclease